jgi:hypothetical protein
MICREFPGNHDGAYEITAAGWRDHLASLSTGRS